MNGTIFNRIVRVMPIASASFTIADLEGLAKTIQDKNNEAIQIEKMEIAHLSVAESEKEAFSALVSDNQLMTIFVNGAEGENLVAYDPAILKSHLLPPVITSVTIETQTFRQVRTKTDSPNSIRLHVDFTRLQFGSPNFNPAGTVQNTSLLQVQGTSESWVVGSFKAIIDRLKVARNSRRFLHSRGAYELGLVAVALPLLIFLADKLYQEHEPYLETLGPILRIGVFVYFILLGLVVYRQLFNYALWTFPSVDLINERDASAKHRKFWFSITTGLPSD